MKWFISGVSIIIFFSIILSFFTACGSGDKRSEMEIVIYKVKDAAVENDVDAFMMFIDYDYLDSEESTKEDIREKVESYLGRFRTISINILNIKTVKKDNDNAEIVAEINFSHGLGKMLSKIIRSVGESYRFHLEMTRRARGWVVKRAEWEWISIDEMYPESLKVLRELFPETF